MSEKTLIREITNFIQFLLDSEVSPSNSQPRRSSFAESMIQTAPSINPLLAEADIERMDIQFDHEKKPSALVLSALSRAFAKVGRLIPDDIGHNWINLSQANEATHMDLINKGSVTMHIRTLNDRPVAMQLYGKDLKSTLSQLTPQILKEAARETATEDRQRSATL